jgi:hypothetical protein
MIIGTIVGPCGVRQPTRDALGIIKRRAGALGLPETICCPTPRLSGRSRHNTANHITPDGFIYFLVLNILGTRIAL